VNLRFVAPGHGASIYVVLVATGGVVIRRCVRGVLILSLLRSFDGCTLEGH
jgi:hypothetical protein